VIGDLGKQNDELHKIGVRLLPERFLAFAKEVVQKRCNAVGKGVGVQVVVQWVVTVFGIETDFDVVLGPAMSCQNFLHLMAEIAFHFEKRVRRSFSRRLMPCMRQAALGMVYGSTAPFLYLPLGGRRRNSSNLGAVESRFLYLGGLRRFAGLLLFLLKAVEFLVFPEDKSKGRRDDVIRRAGGTNWRGASGAAPSGRIHIHYPVG
jgi:hypothetical protein